MTGKCTKNVDRTKTLIKSFLDSSTWKNDCKNNNPLKELLEVSKASKLASTSPIYNKFRKETAV